jgi:hypothetical protein
MAEDVGNKISDLATIQSLAVLEFREAIGDVLFGIVRSRENPAIFGSTRSFVPSR